MVSGSGSRTRPLRASPRSKPSPAPTTHHREDRCHPRSVLARASGPGEGCGAWTWSAGGGDRVEGPAGDHLVDDPVVPGLLGPKDEVAIGVGGDPLDGLAGVM